MIDTAPLADAATRDDDLRDYLGDGFRPHTSHWGAFSARWRDGALAVRPHPADPGPRRRVRSGSRPGPAPTSR